MIKPRTLKPGPTPNFDWLRYPEADTYVSERLDEFVAAMAWGRTFADTLLRRTGSRLVDWLDHLVLVDGDRCRSQLADLGFEQVEAGLVPTQTGDTVYHHPGAIFPHLILRQYVGSPSYPPEPGTTVAAAIQVESISDFLMAHQLSAPIDGTLLSPYRRSSVVQENGREFLAVERRGHSSFVPTVMPADYSQRYLSALERWATRPRLFANRRAGMEHTLQLARSLVSDMDADSAAWIALSVERTHWQQRNRAAQVQKACQDSLGLGWANHDHHTFRSSRDVFPLLIEILETLGFRPRERFYAGADAGWGAQVMEQPACRLAIFADVDLSPEEVQGDFAHAPLPPRSDLSTVGLWCALHGESMLGAGLHHLAGRFAFDAVTANLAGWGVDTMRPFSDFSYLRQAFTRGERWRVATDQLRRLADTGQIDENQRAQFAEKGAIGSHLENIQRGEGFKGFNQQRISDIIRRTDPRLNIGAG